MIDSLGIYRSLIALVPKPSSRLLLHVVWRIDRFLLNSTKITNYTPKNNSNHKYFVNTNIRYNIINLSYIALILNKLLKSY
jgi:hypothetical protein